MNTIRAFALLVLITAVGLTVSELPGNASTESRLAMAIRHKDLPMVVNQLTDGADINERDEGAEQTPLMRAVLVGDPEIVEVLLAHRAAVNLRDDDGNTALMLAADQGNARIVQRLLQYGATPEARNEAGATALTVARSKGRVSIARLIERAARQNRNRLQQQASRA